MTTDSGVFRWTRSIAAIGFCGTMIIATNAIAGSAHESATMRASHPHLKTSMPQSIDDESRLGHFPEMLSYNQLMTLSLSQQTAYIKAIQGMFVELSENSVGLSDESRAHASLLKMIFPDAFAVDGGDEPLPAAATIPVPGNLERPDVTTLEAHDPASMPASTSGQVAGGCRTEPVQCRAKSRVERRKLFEALPGAKECIFAGNMSKYENGKRCSAVSELALTGLAKPLKCTQPWVLCSPMIFGLGGTADKPEPICVKSQMDATRACANHSSIGSTRDFLVGKDGKGSKYPLGDEWNRLKVFINEVCGNSEASAQFHCEECNIIMKRLKQAKVGDWSGHACDGRTFDLHTLPTGSRTPARAGH